MICLCLEQYINFARYGQIYRLVGRSCTFDHSRDGCSDSFFYLHSSRGDVGDKLKQLSSIELTHGGIAVNFLSKHYLVFEQRLIEVRSLLLAESAPWHVIKIDNMILECDSNVCL